MCLAYDSKCPNWIRLSILSRSGGSERGDFVPWLCRVTNETRLWLKPQMGKWPVGA